jgi:hypothetical protein
MKKLILGVALLALLSVSCGGGSSSGGNHAPLKAVCQACTYGNECESNVCGKFKSGIWRCIPIDAQPGYTCPSGMYKLPGTGTEDSCE